MIQVRGKEGGNGNLVLREMWSFDMELPWLGNLGSISQGILITSSQEAIEGRTSFWMKKTCRLNPSALEFSVIHCLALPDHVD
jgi:hypothetical protein